MGIKGYVGVWVALGLAATVQGRAFDPASIDGWTDYQGAGPGDRERIAAERWPGLVQRTSLPPGTHAGSPEARLAAELAEVRRQLARQTLDRMADSLTLYRHQVRAQGPQALRAAREAYRAPGGTGRPLDAALAAYAGAEAEARTRARQVGREEYQKAATRAKARYAEARQTYLAGIEDQARKERIRALLAEHKRQGAGFTREVVDAAARAAEAYKQKAAAAAEARARREYEAELEAAGTRAEAVAWKHYDRLEGEAYARALAGLEAAVPVPEPIPFPTPVAPAPTPMPHPEPKLPDTGWMGGLLGSGD